MRLSLLPVWLRAALLAAAALFILATPTTLHASVIYNFTLTPDAGNPFGGSGSMTLKTAPSGPESDYTYGNGGLLDLSFNIDGQTFDLFDSTTTRNGALVQFYGTTLNDITFADSKGTSPLRFTLDTTGNYAFYYNDGRSVSTGTFTNLTDPPSVPEPSSIAFLGTGLIAGAGSLYRRFSGRS